MHTLWKNSCSFSTEIEHTERNEPALLSANLSPSLMIWHYNGPLRFWATNSTSLCDHRNGSWGVMCCLLKCLLDSWKAKIVVAASISVLISSLECRDDVSSHSNCFQLSSEILKYKLILFFLTSKWKNKTDMTKSKIFLISFRTFFSFISRGGFISCFI